MKFSTTLTLAALMLMSSGTDARIGGGTRVRDNGVKMKCQDGKSLQRN